VSPSASSSTGAPLVASRGLLVLLAVAAGVAVANIYYAQPLLADMGRQFGVTDRRMGLVAMLSQVGYAAGLLLFVPLGDLLERRSFILGMLGAVTFALLGVAAAPPARLTPEQQKALRDAGDRAESRGWGMSKVREYEANETLKKNGMTIHEPDAAMKSAFGKVGNQILDEWLKKAGPEGQQLIKTYRGTK